MLPICISCLRCQNDVRLILCQQTAVTWIQEAVFQSLLRFRILLGHRIGIRHSCQIQPDLIAIDAILVARSAAI